MEAVLAEVIAEEPTLSDADRSTLAQACKGWGIDPGSVTLCVDPSHQKGYADWRRLLRRYAGDVLAPVPTHMRPSRRCPEWVGLVPGRALMADRPRVLFVVDTSSSISDATLEDIAAELRSLGRETEIIVAECDTRVQRTYRFTGLIKHFQGRGGTDFRPPLEHRFLQRTHPNLIIYATDGEGPAPAKAPRVPLVWLLVPGGSSPAEWGTVIKMQ